MDKFFALTSPNSVQNIKGLQKTNKLGDKRGCRPENTDCCLCVYLFISLKVCFMFHLTD